MNAHTSPLGAWVNACKLTDLIDDVGVCALVGADQVALFKPAGSDRVYAIDAVDPFSDAAVLARGVVGDVGGALVVASPMYKQHFNLETGACLEDDAVKLRTFDVRIVDGWVCVAPRTIC